MRVRGVVWGRLRYCFGERFRGLVKEGVGIGLGRGLDNGIRV